MKLKILNNSTFIIYINSSFLVFNKDNLYDNLKSILIRVRKKYACDIYGYYDVDIYNISPFRTMIKFNKKDDDDLFRNTIDLKINYYNKDIKVYFKDYLVIKSYSFKTYNNSFYLDNNYLKKNDIVRLCEFYDIENLNLQ